ncbi:MAG: DUF1579 family protein [Phycisphaerae bacterium]
MVAVSLVGSALVASLSLFPPDSRAGQPGGKPSQSEMKKRFMAMTAKAGAPTEAHQALQPFVGRFNVRSSVKLGPGEPMRAKAAAHGEWIMGGRFVRLEVISTPDEELKGERLIVLGYDPAEKKYTMWQVESSSLTGTSATGEFDAEQKRFTFEGERPMGGATATFRWTFELRPRGVIDQVLKMKAPGANEFAEFVHVVYSPLKK